MKKRFLYTIYTLKKILRSSWQQFYGAYKISALELPIVTIFGSARLTDDTTYSALAHELAHKLIREEISVLTGGGPGIMRAASCGAMHAFKETHSQRSIAIAVKGLDEKYSYECAPLFIMVNDFYVRKWLMINFAAAFAIFPGGFGTLDEFTEIVTLIQTKKLSGAPIVLIGKDYWGPFIQWLKEYALAQGMINNQDLAKINLADDLDTVIALLKAECIDCKASVIEQTEK